MIKRLAIVTLYDEINIGNKLQNYALQETLKGFANEVTTLTYSDSSPVLGWKGRLAYKLGFPKGIATEKRSIVDRWNRFRDFSKRYINTSEPISFSQYGKQVNDTYDFFVVGSDQVWHNFTNSIDELNYFLLSFVDDKKKVCYAPSFGFESFPEQYLDKYREGLERFRLLSCREQSGCKLIERFLDRKAELLADPTMLLDVNKWSSIEKKPEYTVPSQFILSYFLGDRSYVFNDYINELSRNNGVPIIDIFDINNKEYYTTRPDEFLYLIKRAMYVCTNSFHGSAFSILFHKPLKIFGRNDGEGKKMGGRIATLIDQFGLEMNKDGIVDDYNGVNAILQEKREQARRYLVSALSNE